jgi:hypothetical protein
MNISRHVSFLSYHRQFRGRRPLQRVNRPISTTATTKTVAACLSITAVIGLFCTASNEISRKSKTGRRSYQNTSHLPPLYMYFWQSNQTRCDSLTEDTSIPTNTETNVHYSEAYDPDLDSDSSGYTEAERFYQCVTYHRSLLHDYVRRWGNGKNNSEVDDPTSNNEIKNNFESDKSNNKVASNMHIYTNTSSRWQRNVPHLNEVKALECDLTYCQHSPEYKKDVRVCQSTKFLVASFYVSQYNNSNRHSQREKGFRVVKELAEEGYPDAMCLYGKVASL